MPDHAEQSGKILALQPEPEIGVKYDRAELHRNERLQHVDQNHTNCEFSAVNAIKIGQPRVVAAVPADVVLIKQIRRNDRAVTAACQIGTSRDADHQRGGSKRQFVHETPPKNGYRYFNG